MNSVIVVVSGSVARTGLPTQMVNERGKIVILTGSRLDRMILLDKETPGASVSEIYRWRANSSPWRAN